MLETEENITKQSSFISRVASWSSQAPCAFGPRHGSHALAGERGERRIIDHHREMEETAQRLRRGVDLGEESLHVVRRADVCARRRALPRRDLAALLRIAAASGVDAPLRLVSTRWRAPHVDQPSASTLPNPPKAPVMR